MKVVMCKKKNPQIHSIHLCEMNKGWQLHEAEVD